MTTPSIITSDDKSGELTMDVTSLYVSSIDVKPITVESWSDVFGQEDIGESADYWETFDYDHDHETHTLLSRAGQVVGVIIAGTLYTDHDDYADAWRGDLPEWDDDAEPPIRHDMWSMLMDAEPYSWGAEGPMMNYWYPVESIDDDDDAQAAAVAIDGLPLCVVMVGGTYGLALTGGGMDLSWDICQAYVRTGNLPPVHFADLPSFAGGHGYHADALAAMRRSLTITAERAQRSLDRLADSFGALS